MGRINKAWIERRKHDKPSVQTTLVDPPADALLKSVNDTAGNARNLFVTYILLSVYIFLTVGATNDEQLLRDSSVAVPFLSNINLPVSRFYQFVPWMFLFVHVDLLLLFKLMADKLHSFNAELDRLEAAEADDLRRQLEGLPFVHWLAGGKDDGFSYFITGLVVWSSLLVLPLLTLLALQIGFLPYHGVFTTFAHQLALGLDALALIWFWPRLAAGMAAQTWRWWLPFGAGRPVACRGLCRTASMVVLLGSVGFGEFVLVLPGENLQDDGLVVHGLLDGIEKTQPSVEEIKEVSQMPWHDRRRIEIALRNNRWFADAVLAHLPLLHRNLDLHEKLLVTNEPDLETLAKLQEGNLKPDERKSGLVKIKGLDLQNRDLRFANLSQTKLWKADLRGTKLQKADLSFAQLQEIQWGFGAQLQGASLWEAQLQGAVLGRAQLQGADLRAAQLQGANLGVADLQGADLGVAQLQGADLWGARLQGADLSQAKIGSSNFKDAVFALNDFSNVKIEHLYTQQDFEDWKSHIRGFIRDKQTAQNQQQRLQALIGKPADFSDTAILAPCLADAPKGHFKNCLSANPAYFNVLAGYLGDLACKPDKDQSEKDRIAKGVAWQVRKYFHRSIFIDFYFSSDGRWGGKGAAARRQLAQRLLRNDCAGKAGLDDGLRAGLRKLAAEAPAARPAPRRKLLFY